MRTRVMLNLLRWLHTLVTCRLFGVHAYGVRRLPVDGYRFPRTFVVAATTCRRCKCSPSRWAAGALVRA